MEGPPASGLRLLVTGRLPVTPATPREPSRPRAELNSAEVHSAEGAAQKVLNELFRQDLTKGAHMKSTTLKAFVLGVSLSATTVLAAPPDGLSLLG